MMNGSWSALAGRLFLATVVSLLTGALACSDTEDHNAPEPEPPPELPELPPDARIQWDPQAQMVQVAGTSGCDSWTPTWAPDGTVYSAVGDCKPMGVPLKLGMGFGRITGDDAYG